MMWVIVAIGVVIVLWAIGVFNSLVRKNTEVKTAWSDIDVQLKRRYDLIPNLVETVKGYMTHEANVLENVTKARTAAMSATGTSAAERTGAENQLSSALKTLFAVAENYPLLRASDNFQQLQQQLSAVESDLQSARRYYNAAVRDLNTKIQIFPSNIIAAIFHFTPATFFQAEESEKAVPKVAFS